MGRAPCCDKANVKKGPWSPEEDSRLKEYIEKYGTGGNWIALPHKAGLKRCGKSCRLRWLNYLRPNLKHGEFSDDEDRIICSLFGSIGSRWSIIASQLPGRTDNDIKNYWNTKLKKKLLGVLPPQKQLLFHQPPLPTHGFPNASPLSPPNLGFQILGGAQDLNSLTSPLLHLPQAFQSPYNKQMKDGLLTYGGDQSCSSSDGSYTTNQIHYNDQQYDQIGLESYLYNGLDESAQKMVFSIDRKPNCVGAHEMPSSLVDYGLEEIKQLISTNDLNFDTNMFFSEPSAIKSQQGRPFMYY